MRTIPEHLFPFRANHVQIQGHRLHYVDEGSGPPVVMVHGNPTWSFYYRNLVRELSPSHRCVVPDHIGCGRSDTPDDDAYPYRLQRRIEDFGALMDHLQLQDINLVVHDWGGMIGLGWAVRHPERVRRLVVLNTAAFHLLPDKKVPWQLAFVRNTALGALLVRGFNGFAAGATRAAVTRRPMPPEIRRAYCAPYDSWHNRIATLRFVQDIPLTPSDPGFDIISETEAGLAQFSEHPILICWGDRDFVFDADYRRRFEAEWPHAEVHAFADAGHYVLEDAGDEISELIRSFLSA
jgi:pimeloyl-ACP methyl ester carboxylesterase